MSYPKELEVKATYTCGHTLHLAKTVHNESEEECFVFTGAFEVCPDCREKNRVRYREVYEMLKDPRYQLFEIVLERNATSCGNRLRKELVLDFGTTSFLVEYAINQKQETPVGLYRGTDFVPFEGYTAGYMEWLLENNEESVRRYEKNREEANSSRRYVPEWRTIDQ